MSGWSGLARRNARRTFRDRREAGQVLAEELASYRGKDDLLVLGLARGGVPVGWEVASYLRAPLDVFLVRKLGVPQWEELAMGAIATGGIRVLSADVVSWFEISDAVIEAVAHEEQAELERRERAYRGGRGPVELRDHVVILVDDGLATGATMRAAVAAARRSAPARVVVAVPVGSPGTCADLAAQVDEVVCLWAPESFSAVGQGYVAFGDTDDDEVREALGRRA